MPGRPLWACSIENSKFFQIANLLQYSEFCRFSLAKDASPRPLDLPAWKRNRFTHTVYRLMKLIHTVYRLMELINTVYR
jgi:hypothetical protein